MYLQLSDFDHLRDDKTVRFRDEILHGVPVVIISYMISNDELWEKPLGVECRGITFEKETGKLISLPFEKFFNVNEKAWTQASVIRDYERLAVLEKRDGSMISPAMVDGKVFLKTKKSFYSDVALEANQSIPTNVYNFCRHMLEIEFCPIFEYTSPDTKIVINYGVEPQFVLLAARDMRTGQYMSYDALSTAGEMFEVPVVENFLRARVDDYLALAEKTEDIEGWVIYTDQGRFKIKTKWYMDRHRLIDVRERDIAGFVLNETLDDLIPNLIEGEADMEVVRRIESQVADDLANLVSDLEELVSVAATIPLGKERADWVTNNCGELAKFVHRGARGIENSDESIRDFYRQRYLSSFSLRSVGNPNFRGDEE